MSVTGADLVTAWEDQSGEGNDLTSTPGNEPELIAGVINGLPVVSSYSLDAIMSTAANFPDTSVSGGTVIIVARQKEAGAVTTLDASGAFLGAGSQVNMQIQRNGGTSIEGAFNATANLSSGLTQVPEDTFFIGALHFDGIGNILIIRGFPFSSAIADIPGYIATPLQFFKTLSAPFGNKQIAECIIYQRNLVDGELASVADYLGTKYGL